MYLEIEEAVLVVALQSKKRLDKGDCILNRGLDTRA
jgi:hypothetical protein